MLPFCCLAVSAAVVFGFVVSRCRSLFSLLPLGRHDLCLSLLGRFYPSVPMPSDRWRLLCVVTNTRRMLLSCRQRSCMRFVELNEGRCVLNTSRAVFY